MDSLITYHGLDPGPNFVHIDPTRVASVPFDGFGCGRGHEPKSVDDQMELLDNGGEEFEQETIVPLRKRPGLTKQLRGSHDDFFQLGMLMCRDALERQESCGGHFRAEYQTEEGEALRDDDKFCHVAAWEWSGDPMTAKRNVEELEFENVHLATRSYK